MRLGKMLVLSLALSTVSCGSTPNHPHEWVWTLYPEVDLAVGFRAQKTDPEGPREKKLSELETGTSCREPADDKAHDKYVHDLEFIAKKAERIVANNPKIAKEYPEIEVALAELRKRNGK